MGGNYETVKPDPYETRAEGQLGRVEAKLLKETGFRSMEDLDIAIEELTREISDLKQKLEADDKEPETEKKMSPEARDQLMTELGEKIKQRDAWVQAKQEYIAAKQETAKGATEKAASLEENNDLVRVRADLAKVEADIQKMPDGPEKDALLVRRADLKKEEAEILDKQKGDVKRAERAAAMREFAAEHEQEAKDAQEDLERALSEPENPDEKGEGEGEEPEAGEKGPEDTAKKPKEPTDFPSRFSRISFQLAKGLADHPPDKDSVVEKMVFQGKGMILRISMAFSKDNDWVDQLDADQQEVLEKTLGLQVTAEKDKKGHTVIKWIKPDEDYEAPDPVLASVFKAAYGDNWKTAMEGVQDTTTLADFAKEPANAKLVAAMRESGAGDDAKVLEFLEQNSRMVKEELGVREGTPEEEPPSFEQDLVKINTAIEDNRFDNTSTTKEVAEKSGVDLKQVYESAAGSEQVDFESRTFKDALESFIQIPEAVTPAQKAQLEETLALLEKNTKINELLGTSTFEFKTDDASLAKLSGEWRLQFTDTQLNKESGEELIKFDGSAKKVEANATEGDKVQVKVTTDNGTKNYILTQSGGEVSAVEEAPQS